MWHYTEQVRLRTGTKSLRALEKQRRGGWGVGRESSALEDARNRPPGGEHLRRRWIRPGRPNMRWHFPPCWPDQGENRGRAGGVGGTVAGSWRYGLVQACGYTANGIRTQGYMSFQIVKESTHPQAWTAAPPPTPNYAMVSDSALEIKHATCAQSKPIAARCSMAFHV